MVRNYFYLIVGLLCILFAVTHSLNGLTTTLTTLDNSQLDNSTKISFTYIWHIIGIENLIIGIALLIMSFSKSMLHVKFTAWLIIVILAFRWLVILFFTLLKSTDSIKQLLPDTVAIFLVIILLFLGTKVKDKIAYE